MEYHCKAFEKLCFQLHGYTNRCVISFIDLYKKTNKNTKDLNLKSITSNDIYTIASKFSEIAKIFDIELEICSEEYDLSKFGIKKGKCIDDKVIEEITGYEVKVKKYIKYIMSWILCYLSEIIGFGYAV